MTVMHVELEESVARALSDAAAKRGTDERKLAAEILARFARQEELRKRMQDPEVAALYQEFAEENRLLAEQGMEDYAAGLNREDKT